jgi:DNA-binding PadR family transcriptional regulator
MDRVFGFALYAEGEGAGTSVINAFVTAIQSLPSKSESPPDPAPIALVTPDSVIETDPAAPVAVRRVNRHKVHAADSNGADRNGSEVNQTFLRAIAGGDGRPASIREATGKNDISYYLRNLKRAGLIESEGATGNIRYKLTAKGQSILGKAVTHTHTQVTTKSNGTAWTLEQRRLLKFLRERGGSSPIAEVRDQLEWSENLFERASDRPDFTIKGNTVSVA